MSTSPLELAHGAKSIATDVRLSNEDILNAFAGPVGVGSLATAVEVLADAVIALIEAAAESVDVSDVATS